MSLSRISQEWRRRESDAWCLFLFAIVDLKILIRMILFLFCFLSFFSPADLSYGSRGFLF